MNKDFDEESVRPALHPCCRIEHDARTGHHSLIYPNGMVRLTARLGTLLKLCDGTRRGDEILAQCCLSCTDCVEELRLFLREAARKGWVVAQCDQPQPNSV